MSAKEVRPVLRRVGKEIGSGGAKRLDASGVRLLLRALLFDGAGVPLWHALAACQGMDEAVFFPGNGPDYGERTAAALEVCRGCPVRVECREDVLAWEMPSTRAGVVGGLTAKDRELLHAAPRSGVAA